MIEKHPGVVFLIGFMAAGKSTVGPLLAQQLGWAFVDLDRHIERQLGKSVDRIFDEDGEPAFRTHETLALAQVSLLDKRVIAVGGGTPTLERNWPYLQRGLSVYLALSLEQLWARLKSARRPLLDGLSESQRLERVRQLLQARLPGYRRADLTVAADDTPLALAQCIARKVETYNW